ncbi:MAG TPA: PDZ domain-containing protein [Tepidisphaeraceae bacterium]|nr:PDZ domain-containing protein [Tepidisphaeraceae bacterium]
MIRSMKWFLPALLMFAGMCPAAMSPEAARKLYDQATPSLMAVQYVWAHELGRQEVVGAGVVVGDDLVMFSVILVSPAIPDEQMKEFKIIVPSQQHDPEEIDAVFQGRDERTNMAFVKPKTPQHWKPVKFEDVPVQVGEPVVSIGMLPKGAAYKSYLMQSEVAATLRGADPQVLVQGNGLAAMSSPVYNADGKAIGLVSYGGNPLLNGHNEGETIASISNPPKFFVPASDFLLSLTDPPTPKKPVALVWTGMAQLTGLSKDVAEALGLKDLAAVQVGEVIATTPAAKAGVEVGDIITKVDGHDLERGDEASELPGILRRRLLRHKVGDEVTFSVLRGQDAKPREIKVTLEEQPRQANLAKRYYAEDLGFVVRELVFNDTYALKLPADQKGVMVAMERPQSAAVSANLRRGDIIIRMNNSPVTDIVEFEKFYKATRKDHPHDPLVVVVQRKTREDTIRIEPPQ